MSRYTAEEKAESIRRARALLQRLADDDARAASADAEPENIYSPEPRLTQSFCDMPLRPARATATAAEAKRQPGKKTMTDNEWAEWADRRIAAALEEHARGTEKAVGEALGIVREQMRDEIKTAVGELRAELSVKATHERGGPIIDLPALPLRRRGHAA